MTETATTAPPQSITERLVAALTAMWRAIQHHHPEVPEVVLTLGSGTLGKRGGETTLGHFAAGRWQLAAQGDKGDQGEGLHELFVSGEGLRRGAVDVVATMLHEAAHGLAAVRGISDTSRLGRYHNKKFKLLGEELGLVITEVERLGWSGTALGPEAKQRYADQLAGLTAAITAYRRDEAPQPKRPKNNWNNLVAECGCPRKIRVARATLAAAPITCGACGEQFTAQDDTEIVAE